MRTLRAPHFFYITTTLYQCANSNGFGKWKQIFWGYGFRFSSAECFLKFGEIPNSARRWFGGMRAGVLDFGGASLWTRQDSPYENYSSNNQIQF